MRETRKLSGLRINLPRPGAGPPCPSTAFQRGKNPSNGGNIQGGGILYGSYRNYLAPAKDQHLSLGFDDLRSWTA